MKKIALFCLFFLNNFSFGNSIWQELADYEPTEYKQFVFIICSCNNKNWYEKNLESAFMQDYPRDKFRIIYVDESRDGTADLVSDYVTARDEWDRFTLIHNESWQSVMHNHYKAAHLCHDHEIIVHLDGDDLLKNCHVLYLLNKVYNKWDIWLTYGQYEDWPVSGLGFSIDVPADIACKNEFRELGFWYSHLRTFYAWLFKKIKLKDLIWRGSFIPTTPAVDYMFMFPMIEMAGHGHYKFIPDVLYLYNRSNSLSTCNMPIKLEIPPAKNWEKYQPLAQKDDLITKKRERKCADILIICNPSDDVSAFVSNGLSQLTGIGKILTSVDSIFSDSENDYCLCITDVSVNLPACNLSDCIFEMEKTGACAFFFGLSKESFKRCDEHINYGPFSDCQIDYRLAFLGNGIAAWQLGYEDYIWDNPALTLAILLRKNDLEKGMALFKQDFSVITFKKFLYNLTSGDREIALLFEQIKITSKILI